MLSTKGLPKFGMSLYSSLCVQVEKVLARWQAMTGQFFCLMEIVEFGYFTIHVKVSQAGISKF